MLPPDPSQPYDLKEARSIILRLDSDSFRNSGTELLSLLQGLQDAPLPNSQYLLLLEEIRISMFKLLAQSKQEIFHNAYKDLLTINEDKDESFNLAIKLLHNMADCYAQIAQQLGEKISMPSNKMRAAVISQRRLSCFSMISVMHYRMRHELPQGLWRKIHNTYHYAEERGIATVTVDDMCDELHPVSNCEKIYLRQLMIAMSGPYSHSFHDIDILEHWAATWQNLIRIEPFDQKKNPIFLLDFSVDRPLVAVNEKSDIPNDAKMLYTDELDLELRFVLNELRSGSISPKIALKSNSPEKISRLLTQVAFPWTQLIIARKFRRFSSSDTDNDAYVASDFPAIHKLFSWNTECSEKTPLLEISSAADALTHLGETWRIINYSAQGFCICHESFNKSLAYGQLLAIKLKNEDHVLLGKINWLMRSRKGQIIAGIHILPGKPEAITVFTNHSNNEKHASKIPAFLLSVDSSALNSPSSLLLPPKYTFPGETLNLQKDSVKRSVTITTVCEDNGFDFDRVTFDSIE